MIQRVFVNHPASVGESYLEHQQVAWGFAWQLMKAAMMCFVHGLLPCLFCQNASQSIRELHGKMVVNRHQTGS
ncbi:MAG: hypothetical protein ACJAYE_001441 [Candidatus Azotimanducaceae bacterium]|jgi:hypothetical protein